MDASCRTAPTVVISQRLWAEAGKAPSLWTAPVAGLCTLTGLWHAAQGL